NQDLGHAPADLGTLGRHVLVALFGDPIQRGDVDTLFTGEPFHGAGGVSLCVESGRDLGSLDGDGAVRFAVGDVGDVDDDATRGGRHGDAAVLQMARGKALADHPLDVGCGRGDLGGGHLLHTDLE